MVAVLLVGHTSEEISNRDQSRWQSLSHNGGLRGLDLARHPILREYVSKSNLREYVSGEFALSNKPPAKLDPHQQLKLLQLSGPSRLRLNIRMKSG